MHLEFFEKIMYNTNNLRGLVNKLQVSIFFWEVIIISRVARKDLNTPFLHVMVQGVNKEYLFYNEWYIKKYLEIIKERIEEFKITIIAYCIMNNHAHFLVYVDDINELGKFMHGVNLQYSNIYNKKEERCGVLFRNRFKAEPIYEIKYLINCIKYIHNNPVKANMVTKCKDYKYSSYNDYITNTGCSQSTIMKSIFGYNYDYSKAFENSYDKRFMDIKDDKQKYLNEYIESSIYSFEKLNNTSLQRKTDAIICTTGSPYSIKDNVLVLPVSAI